VLKSVETDSSFHTVMKNSDLIRVFRDLLYSLYLWLNSRLSFGMFVTQAYATVLFINDILYEQDKRY